MRSEYDEKSAAQNASKTHGKVHDALMQQKKNGNIPGIIGRLPEGQQLLKIVLKKYLIFKE
jgi:hypothetical protein